MTVFEMPQASEDWIKNELKKQMKDDEANEKWQEILATYERFASESPDIGGKANPMSKNFYGSLSAFAYYECMGRKMTPDEITDMCYGMMTAGMGENHPLSKFNLNNPIVRKMFYAVFGMQAKKLNKHKADGSWGNTWGAEINPLNRKEGISIHLVGCPIADFAKAHGYSELMPYFCETDKRVMEAYGGTLYREHTVADGYEDCDYWIKNKGE